MQPLIVVVYDGIANSVFVSQLLAPVIAQLEQNIISSATIISFEQTTPSTQLISSLPSHPRLTLKIESRFRFWGLWTLYLCARRLKTILGTFNRYALMARGPFAGLICKKAQTAACAQLIIQARGLAAQEYRYANHGPMARLRAIQYHALEKKAYTQFRANCTIQAVSPALKKYLINTYGTPENNITIAQHDIPARIVPKQKNEWRIQTRKELSIDETHYVYCYNGSAKSWQCPDETIAYFKQQHMQNPQALLLVLTQDTDQFKQLLDKHELHPQSYRLHRVPHYDIYRYLAAADVGLLFRQPHIINWVSRPTKLLEYQALGLLVKHNNTIELLTD